MYCNTLGFPSVSILIPYFNRKKFEPLIQYNLERQDYPNVREIIIADDSDRRGERLQLDLPMPVTYVCLARCSIGHKRNVLKSLARGEIMVHMDTDDSYAPSYISTLVRSLTVDRRASVTGSSDMLFINPITSYTGFQSCVYLNQINEATMAYKSEYAQVHHFANRSDSENESFLRNVSVIVETPVHEIMVCTIHDGNTVSKTPWEAPQFADRLPHWFTKANYYDILKKIYCPQNNNCPTV